MIALTQLHADVTFLLRPVTQCLNLSTETEEFIINNFNLWLLKLKIKQTRIANDIPRLVSLEKKVAPLLAAQIKSIMFWLAVSPYFRI